MQLYPLGFQRKRSIFHHSPILHLWHFAPIADTVQMHSQLLIGCDDVPNGRVWVGVQEVVVAGLVEEGADLMERGFMG